MPDVKLLHALAGLAHEAGRAILVEREKLGERPPSIKADGSPVTLADIHAEALIEKGLEQLLPGVPMVGEESAHRIRQFDAEKPFLLVDPLDGTREFVGGFADFTVNIAVIERRRPVLGVVHAPALGETAVGLLRPGRSFARHGVFAAGEAYESGRLAEIIARPSPDCPILLVSRSRQDTESENYAARLPHCQRVPVGSSLKFVRLAQGTADLYPRFGATMEWDTAAGEAVLVAAGGDVASPEGEAMIYGKAEQEFRNGPFIARGMTGAMPITGGAHRRRTTFDSPRGLSVPPRP